MNKNLKFIFVITTLYFVIISSVYAYAVPRKKGIQLYTNSTESVSEALTEETSSEITTQEDDTEFETNFEEITKKQVEIETPVQVTTVNSGFSLSNSDENGVPYTGNKLEAYNIAAKTFKDKWTVETKPNIVERTEFSDNVYTVNSKTFEFDDSSFVIKRYSFNVTDTASKLNQSIEISGNTIEIRYVDPDTDQWYMSGNVDNTKKQTLFIDTDTTHMIVSVPGVYTNKFENNTLEMRPELEDKINITKTSTGYSLNFAFPKDTGIIGEIWYLQSDKALADWNNSNHFSTMKQDLAINRRFSWDGYYFPAPSNYVPYSETMLYRQPSDYAGASFARYGDFPAAFDLGFVFTYTCMKNQTEQGFWATGPKSGWLAADFQIGAGFYDTRFNTDFAESLLYAYKRYNNDEFLFAATRYAEYFIDHANSNNYMTKNGGILVQDYGYDYDHTDTHVSLNHQLAELNYLYKLYQITRETKYKDMADLMLKAIEDTQDQWVLANNNLNYALYYLAGTNPMVDYPYLTYNDLLNTKVLYKSIYGKEHSTLEYLINCKKQWMDANDVVGYNTIS